MEPRLAIARITTGSLVSIVAFDAVLRNSGNFNDYISMGLTGTENDPVLREGVELKAVSRDSRKFPFPPAIPIFALILSWIIGKLLPIQANWPIWIQWTGWILFTVPFLFAIWAVITFRLNSTAVDPRGEVTTFVITGPFRYSRNPMYVTLLMVYTGSALAFRLPWAIVLLLPVFLLLHFVVIIPEEKYLESRFGEQYIHYRLRVRRWL